MLQEKGKPKVSTWTIGRMMIGLKIRKENKENKGNHISEKHSAR